MWSDCVQTVIPDPGMGQESKKRLFGGFSVHMSTKEVRPFHGHYPPKVTLVFVAGIAVTQVLTQKHLKVRQGKLPPVLKDIFAAIWAVP